MHSQQLIISQIIVLIGDERVWERVNLRLSLIWHLNMLDLTRMGSHADVRTN